MAETLLAPLDGSELGEAALPWAACLARKRDLTIILARIVPWPSYTLAGGVGAYTSPEAYELALEGQREEASAYLEAVRRTLIEQGLDVQTAIRTGVAAESILDLAGELGAVAIAMSTHGRGGLGRVLLGSVAEQLLQRATVPVLLVRAGLKEPAPLVAFERLLVPLDGSSLAERAVDAARELAAAGTTLVLLRVIPPREHVPRTREGVARLPEDDGIPEAIERAEGYLDGLRRSLADAGYSAETMVRIGEAAAEIVVAAAEQDVDLVVMVTHGRTGPARWWLGSVADQVARHARAPIYLVSARALAATTRQPTRPNVETRTAPPGAALPTGVSPGQPGTGRPRGEGC